MPRKRKSPAEVSATRRRAVLVRWARTTPDQRSQAAKDQWARRREMSKLRADQRAAIPAAVVGLPGARLGISDMVMEEVLILTEEVGGDK
jgi:hypothetical protein